MQDIHVLFVSYDGMTDSLGQSQVLPYIREISKQGYKYTLISFEKEERYQKFHSNIQKSCDASNINWHPIKYASRVPILSTIWNIYRLKNKVFKIHKQSSFDLFHSRSHVPSIVAQMLQKQKNVPYVFDMRGFWADERVDGGVWKLSNPIFKKVFNFFKRKEIEFIEEANAIVSLTENGKNEILSWQHLESTPAALRCKNLDIEVIPCCVDVELFNPNRVNVNDKNRIKEQLGISDNDFILGYVGSIGTWYMLPEMLDFFKTLQTKNPNSKFLFISNEPKEKITSIATKKNINIKNIVVASCIHKDVPTYISLFTISIYFILPAYSKKASSPTKQAELMAMGVPIVCNSNVGDSDKIVAETQSGWVVSSFTDSTYEKIINDILTKPLPASQEIIKKGNTQFNLISGATKFRKTYERILNS
jgi:glycosyltransferase involved in cell wall biosynthesis